MCKDKESSNKYKEVAYVIYSSLDDFIEEMRIFFSEFRSRFVSQYSGVCHASIYKFINRDTDPTRETIIRLAKAYYELSADVVPNCHFGRRRHKE